MATPIEDEERIIEKTMIVERAGIAKRANLSNNLQFRDALLKRGTPTPYSGSGVGGLGFIQSEENRSKLDMGEESISTKSALLKKSSGDRQKGYLGFCDDGK